VTSNALASESDELPASAHDVVLIVEDDEATARAISRLVRSIGLTPRIAASAREARESLTLVDELRALVVDLRLPDGDGFWVAEAARRSAAELPIVILTGAVSNEIVNQAFRLGAHYLCKPLTPPDVSSLRLFLIGAPPQPVVDRVAQWARDKGLAPMETQLLTLALAGLEPEAMSSRIGASQSAVQRHIDALLETLGARDLGEVVRMLEQLTSSARRNP
jgi:FixJ family two-component response regulator